MVIITIGGPPGSGKSTLGRMLATRLGAPFFSMGDVRRAYALERGMTLAELNRRGEADPYSDTMVDEYQSKLPRQHPSFVIDSRLGYHFLPQSVKIFLKADLRVAASRILPDKRAEEHWTNLDEGTRALQERMRSDRARYKKYYGIDPYDESRFDLVLDTSQLDPLAVLHETLLFLKRSGVPVPPTK
jgi:predicted cytidylate kinase